VPSSRPHAVIPTSAAHDTVDEAAQLARARTSVLVQVLALTRVWELQ